MAQRQNFPLILTIASIKGGGGKSNLASNLAVAFQHMGRRPVIVDADVGMRTSEQWHDDREEYLSTHPNTDAALIPVFKKTGRIQKTVDELAATYDTVIVDTGSQDSSEMRTGLLSADVVVTPVEPTREALDGVDPFLELIKQTRDYNEDLTLVAVVSRATSTRRAQDAREELQELDQAHAVHVANSVISSRVSHPDSKSRGLSVVESRDAKAKTEIEALANELLTITKGK